MAWYIFQFSTKTICAEYTVVWLPNWQAHMAILEILKMTKLIEKFYMASPLFCL